MSLLLFHYYSLVPEANRNISNFQWLALSWISFSIATSKIIVASKCSIFEMLEWFAYTIASIISCWKSKCTQLGSWWINNCLAQFIVWTFCWALCLNIFSRQIISIWSSWSKSIWKYLTSAIPFAWTFTTRKWVTEIISYSWISC